MLVLSGCVISGPDQTSRQMLQKGGWQDRYFQYDGEFDYLVGFDLQQLHADVGIDYREKIDFLHAHDINKIRIWLYPGWFGLPGDEHYPVNGRILYPWRVDSEQNKFDLAMIQFKESLKLNPNQPDMLNTLAQTLLTCPDEALRDPSRAVELARQACVLTQSKHPVYLNTLAVAYSKLDNYSEAVKTSEKALALAKAKGDYALVTSLQRQLDWLKGALAKQNKNLEMIPKK